jgi:1-acyl-sn-glycerol-3-phosphate acyltransferase
MKTYPTHVRFQWCCQKILCVVYRIFYRLEIRGSENVPRGGCVVCANHSSYADPPLLSLAVGVREPLAFMAKKELFENPWVNRLICALGAFPLDREKSDIGAIKTALRRIQAGCNFVIFPQGTRQKHGQPRTGAKEGAAVIAVRSKAPVLPVYISEDKKPFGRVKLIVGEPFYPQIDRSQEKPYQAAADEILQRIYALGEEEA